MDEQSPHSHRQDEPATADVITDKHPRIDKLQHLARRHPTMSVLGAAGFALFGGVELAVAVLIGAGVAALVHAGEHGATEPDVRERAARTDDRAPRKMRERARAVMQAMRGKIAPIDGDARAPQAR